MRRFFCELKVYVCMINHGTGPISCLDPLSCPFRSGLATSLLGEYSGLHTYYARHRCTRVLLRGSLSFVQFHDHEWSTTGWCVSTLPTHGISGLARFVFGSLPGHAVTFMS